LKDQSNLPYMKELLRMLQTHYPERLHRAYVVCPPVACRVMWSVIRPFVDPSTKSKVTFCGCKSELQQMSTKFAVDEFTSDDSFHVDEYLSLPFDESLSE
jgi:CRAL/TRIO domain